MHLNHFRPRSGPAEVAGIVLIALLPSTIRAELLYFAKGGRVQAAAEVRGDSVRVEAPEGIIEFHRSDFRKVVPGYWPPREWEQRRKTALAGDTSARSAAAWWAIENGLTAQGEAMLRAIHADDPRHQPTARMIAVLDRLDRACKDPDLDRFRKALGQSFELARGPHVILFHQHGEADVRERLDLLERVCRSFYLVMASRGVDLPAPTTRLMSAWFADQADYQEFLRANHAGVFLATRGYFHPTFRAVVGFDAKSAKDQREAREAFSARRLELDRLEAALDVMPARGRLRIAVTGEPARTVGRSDARDALDRLRRDLARRQLILDLDRGSVDQGTAAHELIHQLVATAGLFRAHDDAPHWLHEGLAAQFEVIRGGRWAGIGRAHDLRLPDWRAIRSSPRLVPLVQDAGFGHGYDRDVYAESWALVYYLRQRRPEEFVRFLDLLRGPDAETARGPERTLKHFATAFGPDLGAVERDWHEFLETVRTPLEEFDAERSKE
ncbi:MAG: DUF1570 domain-containing protein [Isosphaeraceae bacterium]|nr:DUF1570 domain-containing protein [Isosphaeraceae bacterium]